MKFWTMDEASKGAVVLGGKGAACAGFHGCSCVSCQCACAVWGSRAVRRHMGRGTGRQRRGASRFRPLIPRQRQVSECDGG